MRKRELVLLMDGVIRFVDVGTQVGVWPRIIRIGQVCQFEIVLTRLLDDYTMTKKCNVWWLRVAMWIGIPNSIQANISDMGKIDMLAIIDILRFIPHIHLTIEMNHEWRH